MLMSLDSDGCTNDSDDALTTWSSYQQCGSNTPKLCGGNTTEFQKGLAQDFILISHIHCSGNANGPNTFLDFCNAISPALRIWDPFRGQVPSMEKKVRRYEGQFGEKWDMCVLCWLSHLHNSNPFASTEFRNTRSLSSWDMVAAAT
ncbi:hypothetical protein VNO80_08066 [Phaseolus coccineus]|uniref:Uncharacterized protein n=1 Tax=Phaseolus coccineus TaxID=3886 RepID=A0AAN9RK72_PHACN